MSKYLSGNQSSGVLADGTAVVVSLAGAVLPLAVWVNPAEGDTVTVEYRIDDDAPWQAWAAGAVTAYADDVLIGPVSDLRFTRTAGSGTTSAYGVA